MIIVLIKHESCRFSMITKSVRCAFFVLVIGTPAHSTFASSQSDARQVLREAEREASAISNQQMRERLLHDIAVAEAKAKNIRHALKLAAEMEKAEDKDLALQDIAQIQAASGQIDAALRTAEKIQDSADRAWALETIASVQVGTKDFSGALETVALIPEDINRDGTLLQIALAQARNGKVTDSLDTVSQIGDILRKNVALEGIAVAQAIEQDYEEAVSTAELIKDQTVRAETYRDIAGIETRNRQMKRAHIWINRLSSPLDRSSALLGIANGLLQENPVAEHAGLGNGNPSKSHQ